jgi:hypothetical protein
MEKHLTWNITIFGDDKNAARAAQKVVLEEIYLVETKTWRKPGIIPPEVLSLQNKCSTEIIYPKEYKVRRDLYCTLCKFWVTAFAHKSPNKPVMKIECSFFTSFSYDLEDSDFEGFRPFDPEEVEDHDRAQYLYQITPISTAWPYWRELAQNMSTRMGFLALMVPLLKIVPKEIDIDELFKDVEF